MINKFMKTKGKKEKKQWLIFDGRYDYDPDGATIMEVCDTKGEAERNKSDYGTDCVVVEVESKNI